jgi:hypothetical protein
VVFLVGDHAARQRHAVGEVVHAGDFYDVPHFFFGQAEALEAREVFGVAVQGSLGDLDGEVQDGGAALV